MAAQSLCDESFTFLAPDAIIAISQVLRNYAGR
jgi:hypothetical protein